LEECVTNCQATENISKQIVAILSESKCNEDQTKINECNDYLGKLRSLARVKINQITCHIMENIEKFLLRSEEEKAQILNRSIPILA
jgi:hypothetical protein